MTKTKVIKKHFRREIMIIILMKILALFLLYKICFSTAIPMSSSKTLIIERFISAKPY